MVSINKPTGLIRYASDNDIKQGKKPKVNARIIAYSVVLTLLLSVLAFLLITRDDVDVTILRASGAMYQTLPDGRLANIYNIKMANKTRNEIPITLKLENVKGEIEIIGGEFKVGSEGYRTQPFIIKINPTELHHRKTEIKIGVYEGDKKLKTAEVTFMAPSN
jgi:polyferredoxin